MAYYYKIFEEEMLEFPSINKLEVFQGKVPIYSYPCTNFDFTKHVLVELLNNRTPEAEVWEKLGVLRNEKVVHKRLMTDPHRLNRRRAIIVCVSRKEATKLVKRLSQDKITGRGVCAVVVDELLSDLRLFEKQVRQYGDHRSQQKLVYVSDLRRCRDPSSLRQFLTEKFSRFGTILSVLVSEGKDGFALPEGVIRFAYLSEAFAAELAYDQYIIGMERLTVTTHHNILLSQCDLRARLRDAKRRFGNDTYTHMTTTTSPESQIPEIVTDDSSTVEATSNPLHLDESVSSLKTKFPNGSSSKKLDSTKLTDDLENSGGSSSVLHLKDIHIKNSAPNGLDDRALSSRVFSWISDLPDSPRSDVRDVSDSLEIQHDVAAIVSKDLSSVEEDLRQTIPLSPVNSATGSYFTCDDGEASSSVHSGSMCTVRSNLADINDTMEDLDVTIPLEIQNETIEVNEEHQSNVSRSLTNSPNRKKTESSLASSASKRKNTLHMSQKLSLKSQRIDHSQSISNASDSEVTSLYKPKECQVVLKSIPELNSIAKNYSSCGSPAIKLNDFWLSEASHENVNPPLNGSRSNPASSLIRSRLGYSRLARSPDEISCPASEKSSSVRRSSRLSSQRNGAESCNKVSPTASKENERISFFMEVTRSLNELKTESPIRAWLKKELNDSTNNSLSGQKHAKSIICATMNKDILISVGCSHMTCEVCYPDSTNLLLGFR